MLVSQLFCPMVVFACMVSSPLYGQKAAKAAKAKNDRLAVQLPDAYSRVPYNNKI